MLSGINVLDLTDEKGFLSGKILAELGADVIKIEQPGGDPTRNRGPYYHNTVDPEKSLYWFAYNSSKRGITLDIELQQGRELFKRLVGRADVVIESSQPGYMNSLGLGYQELNNINPRVIVVSITPYGQTGPYKDYQASDISLMGMGGIMSITGYPDWPPLRIAQDQSYCLAGAHGAMGVMSALYHRRKSGEGQHVDVSIYECIVSANFRSLTFWEYDKQILKRWGNRMHNFNTRETWRCKDGIVTWLLVGGEAEIKIFQKLIERMDKEGMAHLLKSIDWSKVHFSQMSPEQLKPYEDEIAAFFLTHTRDELEQLSNEENMRLSVIHDINDVAEGEQTAARQLAARNYWQDVEYPELNTYIRSPGFLFKSSEMQTRVRFRAPLIGEHNEEVYETELGLSKQELAYLQKNHVI